MMYQDNFFFSIDKLLATKTDGRRSTYLQFEEDRRGLDPFFVEESGGRTVDVLGSCRLEESGSRGECRSGGATSAQEGRRGGAGRSGGAGWRRECRSGGRQLLVGGGRSHRNLPQIKEAAGECGGGDGADRSRTPLPPSPHHHVRGALSGGRPKKRMHPNRSKRKEQGVARWSIAR